MTANGSTLFDTAIGRCGISWSERGIVGVQLPEAREPETRARLLRHHPEAIEASPPPDIQRALDGIVALLAGEAADLSIVVPCHRVLAASGKVGGFSANGGIATKLRMLSIEAARTSGQGALFESDGAFGFDPVVVIAHLRASDEAIVERLTWVRGIVRWTVEMLLISRLGRADVLPVDDYGVRKGYSIAFRKRSLPAPKGAGEARREVEAVSDGGKLVSVAGCGPAQEVTRGQSS